MPHLGRFSLSDMVRTSAALRRLGLDASSVEGFADRVVHHLYQSLTDAETGEPEAALVRFYKTHSYGDLPLELQHFADRLTGGQSKASTKCLTLLATTGTEDAWCDRRRSQRHRAVPLPSEEVVARLPMIAQLIHQFGLAASSIIEPDPKLLVELDEKTFNVFYVPDAPGSQHIPDQDFVATYGVASALGFGGMLPTGDLYAVVLFSKVAIPEETAELFKTLAVSIKVGLLPLLKLPLFATAADHDVLAADVDLSPPARARKMAVEQLLEVHEQIATDQATRLELAWEAEHVRNEQLRRLADAAIVINSSLSLEEILDRVTDQARLIVGAHQAVTSMTVDLNWAQAVTAVSLSDKYAQYKAYDVAPDGSGIYSIACDTNRPVRMTQAELESHPQWKAFGAQAQRHPPLRGWLAAPLVARDGTNIGLIQLSDKYDDAEFTPEDQAMVVQLAQMAAITIENARLYQREHRIAGELQRSLLPRALPSIAGVEIAARYYAGAAGLDIGGDWYDVFPVANGSFAVVLGDVAGRGITAASVMGQLRMALRVYALEEDSPSAVVSRLDHLLQQLGLVEFATLAYGVWTPDRNGIDLVLAGHPPPVIITPGGDSAFASAEPNVPLGAVQDAAFPATRIPVPEGSTLLLYSDGLVEARDLPLTVGLGRLRRCIAGAPCGLESLCDHIVDQALPAGADADDDITLLAVRATAATADGPGVIG